MAGNTDSAGSSAGRRAPQAQYATLWKAVVSGEVPSPTDDIESWYDIAQHLLGVALHLAQLDQVIDDVARGEAPTVTQHAA